MTKEQFQNLLDRHGADPARWPTSERAVAERLLATDREARDLLRAAERLDAALTRYARDVSVDDAAAGRVLTRLARPLPRQRQPFWRLPAVLLDWQFAPAWPRMAALGACAVIGFFVGVAGVDYQIGPFGPELGGQAGFSSVFDSEPLSGWRP